MGIHPRSIAAALLLSCLAAGTAPAATIQVLSATRSIHANVYLTDDVIEMADGDTLSVPGAAPFSEVVSQSLALGSNTCVSEARQTSAFAPSAFHGEGSMSSYAEDLETFGFSVSGGATEMTVSFRLVQASGYLLEGFIAAEELGTANISLTGPGGTIFSDFAGFETTPFSQSGQLTAGDYAFHVLARGEAHGWPGFPTGSTAAFEVHFVLDAATAAPASIPIEAPRAFPNPFSSTTRIAGTEGAGAVRVFDAAGRQIRTFLPAASILWDGRDDAGAPIPAGVYFLRVDGATSTSSTKLLRIR